MNPPASWMTYIHPRHATSCNIREYIFCLIPTSTDRKIYPSLARRLQYMRTCTCTHARYYYHALDVGVSRKLGSHLSDCRSVGMDFIPLVAETLGGLAKDTIRMTRAIGKALGKRTNPDDPSTSTKHLFGRLAIALWRGNACCWIHRTPLTHPSLDGLI